jgi:hypothetical protein
VSPWQGSRLSAVALLARNGTGFMRKILAAAIFCLAMHHSARAMDYEGVSVQSCKAYLWAYSYNQDQYWDAVVDYAGEKVENMNPPNIIDAVACECKLHGSTIGSAVTSVIAASRAGLYPNIPVGGTMSPADSRWREAFERWIKGNGPRPRSSGHLACDYRR